MTTTYENLPTDFSYQVEGQDAASAMAEFDRRAQARTIVVPTDDVKVKQRLRELGEPIILFAEGLADRRDRLRYLLSAGSDGRDVAMLDRDDDHDEEEEYYTSGSSELLTARQKIAEYSLPRAAARNKTQKAQHDIPLSRQLNHRRRLATALRTYVAQGSQIAGDRPVSIARYSPDSSFIATGSWAGDVSLFTVDNIDRTAKRTGHQEKVGGLAWHPQSTLDLGRESCNLISGGGEGDVCLWSLATFLDDDQPNPLATLKGHGARVVRTEFHPSGDYFASASFDGTWRLWDISTQQELLLQQGHSHEVYTVSFHTDGSLLASGGLDAIGRVWDLRSGKTIMVLDGHVKAIQGLSFSSNGYSLASGSADDTVKIWDLRQIKCTNTLPAHKNLVSDIRFHNPRLASSTSYTSKSSSPNHAQNGDTDYDALLNQDSPYLVSSGYDGSVNIWSASDWTLIKSLQGMDEKKVMSLDVAPNGASICASSWDRTLRVWAAE